MLEIARLDAGSWERLRDVRLCALDDAPDAFGGTLDAERRRAPDEWREWLGLGPWWVASDDGADVGLVAGGRRDGVPWVFSMWVAPERRGRGIAEGLLDEVVAWAKSEGSAVLCLDVTDRAPRALRCYERYGFVATGATEQLRRDPTITLVELRLDLAGR